ncbi:MAG: FHA domain-containing protein, partial [Xanthomonadales bacterium]|nr:FHA domain-containing protein [Xanthomonadales bacterium]
KPRSAPVIDFEIPEISERPEGCDGLLLVEGQLDADTPFKRFCFINTEHISITIGRGDADISIEHATISRAHARVKSDGELMSLSDLGSRNGTFIDLVPCLPGEVLYFEADDKIFLGDVNLTIRVVKQEAQWA